MASNMFTRYHFLLYYRLKRTQNDIFFIVFMPNDQISIICNTNSQLKRRFFFVIIFKMVSNMAARLSSWYQIVQQQKYLILTSEIQLCNVSHRFLNSCFSLIHCLKIITLMSSGQHLRKSRWRPCDLQYNTSIHGVILLQN